MPLTAKLDEFGKPAWIALIVLGFIVWWPLGLCVLAFTIGSGRMMCCGSYGGYSNRWQHKMDRMQAKMDWMRAKMGGGPWNTAPSSGNRAFDEYRTETLKRLEDEQREFKDFLERLRFAKDKTEFDAFMAERRNRPAPDSPPPQA
jgi:hypothetical protein